MTDIFDRPKTGTTSLAVSPVARLFLAPKRGFDPSSLGGRGPGGPKGPKGKPIRLPRKTPGR